MGNELEKLSTNDLEAKVIAHEKKVAKIGLFARTIVAKFGENIERPLSPVIDGKSDKLCHYLLKDFYGFMLDYNLTDKQKSELMITYKSTNVVYMEFNINNVVSKASFFPNDYINKLLPLVNKGEEKIIKEYSRYTKEKKAKELNAKKRKDLMDRAKRFGLV